MIQRRRSVRRATSFRCCRSTSFAIATLWMLLLAQPAMGQPALDQYLYLKESPESVYPIIEIPAYSSIARPHFLYDPEFPHPRIVEFYAHWYVEQSILFASSNLLLAGILPFSTVVYLDLLILLWNQVSSCTLNCSSHYLIFTFQNSCCSLQLSGATSANTSNRTTLNLRGL